MSVFYCDWHDEVEDSNRVGYNEVTIGPNDAFMACCDEALEEYAYRVYATDQEQRKEKVS